MKGSTSLSASLSLAVAIAGCIVLAPVAGAADRTISVNCAVGKNAAIKVVLKPGESLEVKGRNCGLAFTEPFIEKSFSKTPSGTGAGPYVWTVSPRAKAAVFGNARSGVLFVETGDPGNKSGVAFYLIIKK